MFLGHCFLKMAPRFSGSVAPGSLFFRGFFVTTAFDDELRSSCAFLFMRWRLKAPSTATDQFIAYSQVTLTTKSKCVQVTDHINNTKVIFSTSSSTIRSSISSTIESIIPRVFSRQPPPISFIGAVRSDSIFSNSFTSDRDASNGRG
jgi:hypothetical protein